jgi:hypothetical protein
MVRRRFQKENGSEATMTLTPATINVVRFMGKYLHMMALLPLPTVVWNGLAQLFDFYLNAVILFFTPSGVSTGALFFLSINYLLISSLILLCRSTWKKMPLMNYETYYNACKERINALGINKIWRIFSFFLSFFFLYLIVRTPSPFSFLLRFLKRYGGGSTPASPTVSHV